MCGRPDITEFSAVKFNSRLAQHLLQKQPAEKVADGETVRPGEFVDMIGCDQTPRADHVFHNDGRIARNVPAHVTRHRARINVIPAAGREADNDPYSFAFIELILSPRLSSEPQERE